MPDNPSLERKVQKRVLNLKDLIALRGPWVSLVSESKTQKQNLYLQGGDEFLGANKEGETIMVEDLETLSGGNYTGELSFKFKTENISTNPKFPNYQLISEVFGHNGEKILEVGWFEFEEMVKKWGVEKFTLIKPETTVKKEKKGKKGAEEKEEVKEKFEKISLQKLKFSELLESFKSNIKEFSILEIGDELGVFNTDNTSFTIPGTNKPMVLEVFQSGGKRALRILEEKDYTGIQSGKFFPFSLATLIFDTDSVLLDAKGKVSPRLLDEKIYFSKVSKFNPKEESEIKEDEGKSETDENKGLELKEIYEWWLQNPELLRMILQFCKINIAEANRLAQNLLDWVNEEYGVDKKYLHVPKNAYYFQANANERLVSMLTYLSNNQAEFGNTVQKESKENKEEPEEEDKVADETLEPELDEKTEPVERQNMFDRAMQSINKLWGALGNTPGADKNSLIYKKAARVKNQIYWDQINRKRDRTRLVTFLEKSKKEFQKQYERFMEGKEGKVLDELYDKLILFLTDYKLNPPVKPRVIFKDQIYLERVGTIKKFNPQNEEEKGILDTLVILIDTTSLSENQEDKPRLKQFRLMNAFWYKLFLEMEKLRRGEKSRLGKFISLDNNNFPLNRIGVVLIFSPNFVTRRKFGLDASNKRIETYIPRQDEPIRQISYEPGDFPEDNPQLTLPFSKGE